MEEEFDSILSPEPALDEPIIPETTTKEAGAPGPEKDLPADAFQATQKDIRPLWLAVQWDKTDVVWDKLQGFKASRPLDYGDVLFDMFNFAMKNKRFDMVS